MDSQSESPKLDPTYQHPFRSGGGRATDASAVFEAAIEMAQQAHQAEQAAFRDPKNMADACDLRSTADALVVAFARIGKDAGYCSDRQEASSMITKACEQRQLALAAASGAVGCTSAVLTVIHLPEIKHLADAYGCAVAKAVGMAMDEHRRVCKRQMIIAIARVDLSLPCVCCESSHEPNANQNPDAASEDNTDDPGASTE